MRINKFIAAATGLSRRAADHAIAEGKVLVNGNRPSPGYAVVNTDHVTLDGRPLDKPATTQTIMFNKPAGYVVSREGQGSSTVYDLLPAELHHLKPVGRLDMYSSGLLLLTNDGALAQELTHPRYQKTKVYEVTVSKPLAEADEQRITGPGVQLGDGPSRLQLAPLGNNGRSWQITMREGRNRQIRRTFLELGYGITSLHRTQFGDYTLGDLASGAYRKLTP